MGTSVCLSELYSSCTLCPNMCHVDRNAGETGICGQNSTVRVAWSGLHRGEEPPVSGENGSGMIFFCGCPLHCRYCQNYQISSAESKKNDGYDGIAVTTVQLASLMTELQAFGACTVNLVTGTHFIPTITESVNIARKNGLSVPVVWNSSGYENVSSLRLIDSIVDLYLFDVKTLNPRTASVFCGLEKYAEAVVPAVSFLKRRHPVTDLSSLKGTLVRHLVFPGEFDATLDFLKWYRDNLKDCSLLSLMTQFVPPKENPGFRGVSDSEYKRLEEILDIYGIDGFIQEPGDNEILWIPDFRRDNPFPKGFADPLPYFLSLKASQTPDVLNSGT